MTTVLDKILATKRNEVAAAQGHRPAAELCAAAREAPAPRDFASPLAVSGKVSLIAEVKRASPSRGVIRPDFQPIEIGRAYERGGASCLSVLTDREYFQGSLDDLAKVRATVDLPVLRKDFVIDHYQLLEARAAGADAVLLIAECLDDDQLQRLHDAALEMGMSPLVECYSEANLHRILDIGCRLIGINNRDLRTFEVDLQHSIRLRAAVPHDRVLVSESGIRSHAHVRELAAAGVDAMLVGEHLMAQPNVEIAVKTLLGR